MKINGTGTATVNGVTLIEYYFEIYEISEMYIVHAHMKYIQCMQMKFDLMCFISFPSSNTQHSNKYSPKIYGMYVRDLSHASSINTE